MSKQNELAQLADAVTVDGSNVGIGTSSPDTELNIGFSGADDTNTIRVEGSNGASERYAFDIEADGENARTNFKIGVGGGTPTSVISIDASGRVTKPNQPAFSIFADGGFSYTSNIIYRGQSPSSSSFDTNIGNHFSYTTGKFTAPVAGTYFFSFRATMGDANSHFIDIHKNGTRVGGHTLSYGYTYITATNTAVLTLASGDYIEARRRATGYSIYSANFSGYLIG